MNLVADSDPLPNPTLAARLDKDLDLNKLTTCTVKKNILFTVICKIVLHFLLTNSPNAGFIQIKLHQKPLADDWI